MERLKSLRSPSSSTSTPASGQLSSVADGKNSRVRAAPKSRSNLKQNPAQQAIAKQTRLNTKRNSSYMKCLIEWKEIVRPVTREMVESAVLAASLANGELEEDEVDEEVDVVENVDTAVNDYDTDGQEEEEIDEDPSELMEFDELVGGEVEDLAPDDDRRYERRSSTISFDSRVAVTRFYKKRAPKDISLISETFKKKTLSPTSAPPVETAAVRPIIKRRAKTPPLISISSNGSLNQLQVSASTSPTLSPTRTTISVNKFLWIAPESPSREDEEGEESRRRSKRRRKSHVV